MAFCTWRSDECYRDHFEMGVYVCSGCGYEMFSSFAKYEHHTPWPAFKKPFHLDSLAKIPEEGRPNALKAPAGFSDFEKKKREKTTSGWFCHYCFKKNVSCGRCGNGLGHEFLKDRDDGGSRF